MSEHRDLAKAFRVGAELIRRSPVTALMPVTAEDNNWPPSGSLSFIPIFFAAAL